jgi:hypothetical protein
MACLQPEVYLAGGHNEKTVTLAHFPLRPPLAVHLLGRKLENFQATVLKK